MSSPTASGTGAPVPYVLPPAGYARPARPKPVARHDYGHSVDDLRAVRGALRGMLAKVPSEDRASWLEAMRQAAELLELEAAFLQDEMDQTLPEWRRG